MSGYLSKFIEVHKICAQKQRKGQVDQIFTIGKTRHSSRTPLSMSVVLGPVAVRRLGLLALKFLNAFGRAALTRVRPPDLKYRVSHRLQICTELKILDIAGGALQRSSRAVRGTDGLEECNFKSKNHFQGVRSKWSSMDSSIFGNMLR